jgi:hypothetical protein
VQARNGGIVMVNFYSDFVQCNKSKNATLDDVIGEYRTSVPLLSEFTPVWYRNLRQQNFHAATEKKKEIAFISSLISIPTSVIYVLD